MARLTRILILAAALVPAFPQTSMFEDIFIEKPYLQLGDSPKLATPESLMLLWHTRDQPAAWTVQVQTSADRQWRDVEAPKPQKIDVSPVEPHLVWRARLTGLPPGESFRYRLLKGGRQVFEAGGQARKSAQQPYRFALFGDTAQRTAGEIEIVHQVAKAKPDFAVIAGDIVYTYGRITEYRDKFFPIYNADKPAAGAPLIRSIPFIAAPGNHDTALTNFARFTDALAYFLYWDQPLNGPAPVAGVVKSSHVLNGSPDAQKAFLAAAASRYPRMSNFSFEYGNAHWTVIDSNTYMDWSVPAVSEWVSKDLGSPAARAATWRFVVFHHPGFNSSRNHFSDQWMRVLSPAFEEGKADIVFAGHVHNYQRTYPLTFAPKPHADGKLVNAQGEVDGDFKFDKEFGDGGIHTSPHGVIYIVTGGGGAALYNTDLQATPEKWQPFTQKYVADRHSFTLVEITGSTLRLRQIDEAGKEVDTFQIVKPSVTSRPE